MDLEAAAAEVSERAPEQCTAPPSSRWPHPREPSGARLSLGPDAHLESGWLEVRCTHSWGERAFMGAFASAQL